MSNPTSFDSTLDVLAIGNAVVDALSRVDDATVAGLGLTKGSMSLVDLTEADRVWTGLGPDATQVAGGSAANTAAGIASLGGSVAYLARVADDPLGRFFGKDLREAGVAFDAPAVGTSPGTGRCVVLVTPDGERVMRTYLGASTLLVPDDVDEGLVRSAGVVYAEGYLWDTPTARDAVHRAIAAARRAGTAGGDRGRQRRPQVALSLSDLFCVERHRDEFAELVAEGVDLLFANEAEATTLFDARTLEEAAEAARAHGVVAVFTRGGTGSLVADQDQVRSVPAWPVTEVVDTTGAGDLFAAGFLHGFTRGADLPACARLGSLVAAEVIGHLGARPGVSLASLAKEAGLAV